MKKFHGWAATILVCTAIALNAGPPVGDFANYYTLGALWLEGSIDPHQVYDYRWFTEQAARVGFGDQLVGLPVLTPTSALLGAPFVPFGVDSGRMLWWVGQAGLLALVVWATARSVGRPLWWGLLGVGLLGPSVHQHFVQGQFHLPAVLALALGFWAWTRGRWIGAGSCWALAIGLKVHAWPLWVLMALARQGRVVLIMALVLLFGGGVSVMALGWPIHEVYFTEIGPAAGAGRFVHPWHVAFQGLGQAARHVWLPHAGLNPGGSASVLARLVPTLVMVLTVGITVLQGLSWQRLTQYQRQQLIAAAAMVGLASGPLLATYHLVLLIPPVVWAVDALLRQDRKGQAIAVVACAGLAGWVSIPQDWLGPGLVATLASIPRFWAVLVLWALMMPWSGLDRRGLVGLAGLLALVGSGLARSSNPVDDGAQPMDHPDFPLVAADLTVTADGLWFAGLSPHRGGRPGRGWMGFFWEPDGEPTIVASDPRHHVWSPQVVADTVVWNVAPNPTRSGPAGGGLEVRRVQGQSDVFWVGPNGASKRLTSHPAQDTEPVWDGHVRIYFLSDRGVGVRAHRLWWVPWDGD